MLSEDKYFQTLTPDELWQRYCGFLDLSIEEFMGIQKELLMDQIDRVADSFLGKKIMNNRKPKTVEEFRRVVPLTTYDDYEPYLSERREDVLAIKPYRWTHSAGHGGHFKWVPYTSEMLERITQHTLACTILASTKEEGKVNVAPGTKFIINMPPPPYVSGAIFHDIGEQFSFRFIPPLEQAEKMEMRERIGKGFQMALCSGVDLICSLASVMVKTGEMMAQQAQNMKFSRSMLRPETLSRLTRAWVRSKREKRPILPKDLWAPKAVMAAGVDTTIYRDDIIRYWGQEPYESYVCNETFVLAIQSWNRKWMTFLPDMAFYEFIPEEEVIKGREEGYEPTTVLLDKVKEGGSYELVLTHFYGMPLLRYRMGDIIKFTALEDQETGIKLPQMVFCHRVGETIDLAGLATLDERTVWRAIANIGIKYEDWSALKEYVGNQAFLRLYLELRPGEKRKVEEIERSVNEQLRSVDVDYRDIASYLELQPVKVTLLSPGTFQRYFEERIKEGANPAHLKPDHINAPETAIQRLLQLNEGTKER